MLFASVLRQVMSHSKKRTTTTLIHRHVKIDDRPTSLALEPEFWQYLREIAYTRRVTLGRLLSVINQHKGKDIRLASALRLFVAQHYRELAYPRSSMHEALRKRRRPANRAALNKKRSRPKSGPPVAAATWL